MTTDTNLCPVQLSWATFQRKLPSGKNEGIVHDMPRSRSWDGDHSENELLEGLSL
jgi:hypothetical protein